MYKQGPVQFCIQEKKKEQDWVVVSNVSCYASYQAGDIATDI